MSLVVLFLLLSSIAKETELGENYLEKQTENLSLVTLVQMLGLPLTEHMFIA
jgi:hypothetical protein